MESVKNEIPASEQTSVFFYPVAIFASIVFLALLADVFYVIPGSGATDDAGRLIKGLPTALAGLETVKTVPPAVERLGEPVTSERARLAAIALPQLQDLVGREQQLAPAAQDCVSFSAAYPDLSQALWLFNRGCKAFQELPKNFFSWQMTGDDLPGYVDLDRFDNATNAFAASTEAALALVTTPAEQAQFDAIYRLGLVQLLDKRQSYDSHKVLDEFALQLRANHAIPPRPRQ